MSDVANRITELRVETDETRLGFLQADLGISFTFADLALTELNVGDRAGAEQALEHAEKGYSTVQRLSNELTDEESRRQITAKLHELRDKLDHVREFLRTSDAPNSTIPASDSTSQ